jgi:hypothetical protein
MSPKGGSKLELKGELHWYPFRDPLYERLLTRTMSVSHRRRRGKSHHNKSRASRACTWVGPDRWRGEIGVLSLSHRRYLPGKMVAESSQTPCAQSEGHNSRSRRNRLELKTLAKFGSSAAAMTDAECPRESSDAECAREPWKCWMSQLLAAQPRKGKPPGLGGCCIA